MKNCSYLLLCSVLIISAGCAGNKKPNTTPDKPDKAEVNKYLIVPGCDGGKKIKDVRGSLKSYREKMFERNMRFMDSAGHKGEKKIFEQCDSIEAIDRFFAQFWGPVRDPDKSTSNNEYKDLVDGRILDIENEVFFSDSNIPGTSFAANGGLKGDMAHVYLLRGAPHYTAKLHNTNLLSDMIAWVYFDPSQRPLFVFIFYNKGTSFRVFRSHIVMETPEALMDVLREVARVYPSRPEDYTALYQELIRNDTEYIFQYGLRQFSYDSEIRIDKVLEAPTPEMITAKALQPRIIGVPVLSENTKLIFSRYNAVIPGFLTMNRYPDGSYKTRLTLGFSDIDWEKKDGAGKDGKVKEVYGSRFEVTLIFRNEKTRDKKEYNFTMTLTIDPEIYDANRARYWSIDLDDITNKSSSKDGGVSIPNILKDLTPGDYEVKLKLLDLRTLKSGLWLQYITIS